ncbi:MAG: hypothetical protein ACI8R9_000176 [Paraglaciecola sp.]|jgi:hypothetical protein
MARLNLIDTALITPDKLANKKWAFVGFGGQARALIRYCENEKITFPCAVYIRDTDDFSAIGGVAIKREDELENDENYLLVFGTDTYQYQIILRLQEYFSQPRRIYDISAFLWSNKNVDYLINRNVTEKYKVIIDINPAEHVEYWLKNLFVENQKKGVDIQVYHPLDNIDDDVLTSAIDVLIWNGSTPIFKLIKNKLHSLKVHFKYIECGFFPQDKFYYIDCDGINAQRSIANSPLSWVTKEMKMAVTGLAKTYFVNTVAIEYESEYIFIPLQMPNDSNVQENSLFVNGMQDFIDYIQCQYPNDLLIFKVHPKDKMCYTTSGRFVNQDSRGLVMGAKLVHGINSTVLFEAALLGKPLKAEGNCLLNHLYADHITVLAAMLATQTHI